MAKDAQGRGPVGRAVARVLLGPVEGRRTPGPTDQELRELTEQENKKDGEN